MLYNTIDVVNENEIEKRNRFMIFDSFIKSNVTFFFFRFTSTICFLQIDYLQSMTNRYIEKISNLNFSNFSNDFSSDFSNDSS